MIQSDNQGAVFIASNPTCHTKLKHVAMISVHQGERSKDP